MIKFGHLTIRTQSIWGFSVLQLSQPVHSLVSTWFEWENDRISMKLWFLSASGSQRKVAFNSVFLLLSPVVFSTDRFFFSFFPNSRQPASYILIQMPLFVYILGPGSQSLPPPSRWHYARLERRQATAVHAFITSGLYYCNCLCVGVCVAAIVQNAAARLLMCTKEKPYLPCTGLPSLVTRSSAWVGTGTDLLSPLRSTMFFKCAPLMNLTWLVEIHLVNVTKK